MQHFRLSEVSYEKPEGIESTYYLVDQDQQRDTRVLVISFRGAYPDGSLGNRHGGYIAHAGLCGVHAFSPEALVLDFRELHYRWGNTMLAVFQDVSQFMDADLAAGGYRFPIVVVASEKSSGLHTLLRAPEADDPFLFDDIDKAIAAARERGLQWLHD